MNNFIYSDDNKRYHTLAYYNKHFFGFKVHKAVVDAGLTCPNIDGTKGFGGCIYCAGGSGYFTDSEKSVKRQIEAEINRIKISNPLAKINVYYQSNSNTYTTNEKLEEMLKTALSFKDVVGVTLGTRADCITSDTIKVLNKFKDKTHITIELGLQSSNDETARLINRCSSFKEFCNGYNAVKNAGFRTCVHIINGLPLESESDMLNTARDVAKLKPDGIKIHLLHIIKGTKLEKLHEEKAYNLLSKEDYIRIVVNQLELLPASTVVERLTGDGDKKKLIAPLWSKDKISILGSIDKRMAELDTYQGAKNPD